MAYFPSMTISFDHSFLQQEKIYPTYTDVFSKEICRLAEAEKRAEAEGQKLFDAIMAENAERADSERAAAAKKLYTAAEYIIGKAGQA